jgi:hypothetical protein
VNTQYRINGVAVSRAVFWAWYANLGRVTPEELNARERDGKPLTPA